LNWLQSLNTAISSPGFSKLAARIRKLKQAKESGK
jgi:hypothetical protein